jgi:hypothetical protein
MYVPLMGPFLPPQLLSGGFALDLPQSTGHLLSLFIGYGDSDTLFAVESSNGVEA